MSVTSGNETSAYLDRVAAALADVPADDRDELLDDLRAHLAEVAAEIETEDGATLESRLGTPEEYAAELRASAGFGPAVPPGRPRRARRGPRTLARAAWARPEVGAVVDFLPELRPAWWVLRGVAVALILAQVLGLRLLVGILLAVPAVVLSVRYARGAGRTRFWRAGLVTANVVGLLALAGLVLVRVGSVGLAGAYGPDQPVAPAYQVYQQDPQGGGVLTYNMGTVDGTGGSLVNIYPYDKNGRPLHDVLLYDQDGNPIALTGQTWVDEHGTLVRHLPYGPGGRAVTNAFPQNQSYEDDSQSPPVITTQQPPVVRPPAFGTAPTPSK
jgi:hypothetical protein